ncbi:type II secretion system protein [bacterium]|nr:type II secretion system protein [bacterium]
MKKGFTLSELLMALTIVGVIAVLTVPVMMNNVHNKMFATQVKNMSAMIEQLAQDQLLVHRTRDLSDTDFGDAATLLNDKNFAITKNCAPDKALKDCWKTTADGDSKVKYKKIGGSNMGGFTASRTVILKNGVIVKYNTESNSGKTVGFFMIDINGNDKPNILGRDLFGFYVTPSGHVADCSILSEDNVTLEDKINKCKANSSPKGTGWCYGALVDNGWKMDY